MRYAMCIRCVDKTLPEIKQDLSYDTAVIQWIPLCHKNHMTTRVITLWRIYVT